MDVNQGYPAWLTRIETENSTLALTFDDGSGVLFSLIDHSTTIIHPSSVDDIEAECD